LHFYLEPAGWNRGIDKLAEVWFISFMDKLTQQLRLFCEEYAKTGNGEKSAIAVGYSRKNAAQQASRLLTKAKAVQYIEELRKKAAEKVGMTLEELLNLWRDFAQDDELPTRDRIKSSELIGKHLGAFIERHEVDQKTTVQIIGLNDIRAK
jgi:phage terminase small subunit